MNWQELKTKVENKYVGNPSSFQPEMPTLIFNESPNSFMVYCRNERSSAGKTALFAALSELAGTMNAQMREDARIAREAKEAEQREFEAFWAAADKVYIRFGGLPENSRSFNYRDSVHECGVSAYEAIKTGENQYQIKPTLTFMLSGGDFIDRPAYLLEGEVVGTGTDGEPCLKVTKKISIKNAVIETSIGVIEAK